MPKFETLEEELEFLDSLADLKTRQFKRALVEYMKESAKERDAQEKRSAELWSVVLHFQKQFRYFAESVNNYVTVLTEKLSPRRSGRRLDG
jgi:hypothetical protein